MLTVESTDRPESVGQGSAPRWWLLAVLFLFYGYTYVDRLVLSLLVPEIKRTVGLSDTAIGLIMGPAPMIVFALASLPAGWAADRFPRKLVLFAGSCCFALATIALGLSHSYGALLVARIITAIGEATILPCCYSLLADAFPRKQIGTAIAIYSMGGKVGNAGALAIGGLALAVAQAWVSEGAGFGLDAWQLVFIIMGVPILMSSPLTLSFREPPRRGVVSNQSSRDDLLAFLRKEKRLLLSMTLGFAAIGMNGTVMNSWIPTYLSRHFGMTPVQYGPTLGLIGLVSAAALGVKGMIMDWFYARGVKDIYIRLYVGLLIVALPLLAMLFWVQNVWAFLPIYGFVQIVTIPYISYASTAIQVIAPSNVRARLMAIALIIFSTTGGLGTFIVGALTDHVFGSEAKLGYALATVVVFTVPTALICLAVSLKPLRDAVVAAEGRDRGACIGT